MTILMIHEMNDRMLELDYGNSVLTFDDGLYSQYVYYQKLKHLPNKKLFFISSGIICNGAQSAQFPTCSLAHQKAFNGNFEDYMTLDQIRELAKDPTVEIGGHSHSHTRLNKFDSLIEKVNYIKQDTEQMLAWFDSNLQFKPTSFCFPYNEDLNGMYKGLLEKYGFINFYGSERIPVETLLHN